MVDPVRPESVGTAAYSAKQLLVWQLMGVCIALMTWSLIDSAKVLAALAGGAAVVLPNLLTFYLIGRVAEPMRIVAFTVLRSLGMMGSLIVVAFFFKTELLPLLTTAGVAILIPVLGPAFLPRKPPEPRSAY